MSETPKGYKMSEVGVIPEDWEVNELGELGSFSKGKGIRKDEVVSEGLPCIRYGEIYTIHNDYIKSFKSFITQSLANESIEIENGDLLFAGSGETAEEIGKCVAFVGNERVFAGGDIVILRPSININSLFLGFLLNHPIVLRQKVRMGQGDAVVHINGKNLSEIQIPLPPLPEQQAIAVALSDVDALITALEQLISKKRNIKQGAMQQLLTGKKRLPGFGGEWEVTKLGEICNKFLNGGTPSTQKAEYWNGNIPWISGADIVHQKITEIRRFISEDAVKNSSTNIVEKGNLLLVTRTGVGKMTIAPFDIAISQDLTGVYIKNNELNTKFLFCYFDFNSAVLKNLNQGTSIAGITRETLTSTPISIPPTIKEQQAIAQIFSDIDAEIEALEQKRDKYKTIKQGMMQELLTGKTRLV
jgi:type I restriction enzyme S subunit